MNVLVTGAKGQLGWSLRTIAEDYPDLVFDYTDVEELDITNASALQAYFSGRTTDYVVNCAAYTAVDKAEEEVDKATLINVIAVKNLAQCADQFGFTLIHISTDYVFSGRHYRPYVEDDQPDPLSVYSRTKYAGEQAASSHCQKSIIIRTSWLYSEYGNNFLKTILRLADEREAIGIIDDQVGTPTYAADLAKALLEIIQQKYDQKSVFHFSNEGAASWYDFGVEIVRASGLQCSVNPIPTEAYPLPAARPYYSLMSKRKIKETFDLEIPHWRDSLLRCLKNMKLGY